jgi:hypothetical protein
LRPAQANSKREPISKITTARWTGGVPQAIEHLFANVKPKFKHQSCQKKIKKLKTNK